MTAPAVLEAAIAAARRELVTAPAAAEPHQADVLAVLEASAEERDAAAAALPIAAAGEPDVLELIARLDAAGAAVTYDAQIVLTIAGLGRVELSISRAHFQRALIDLVYGARRAGQAAAAESGTA